MRTLRAMALAVQAIVSLGTLVLASAAEVVVDQSFLPPDDLVRLDTQIGIAPFYAGAQTFTPQVSGVLAAIDLAVRPIGGEPSTAQLRLTVETTTSVGRPSGSVLGVVTLPASFLGNPPTIYQHVGMEGAQISLNAGERYAIVFRAVPFISAGNAAYSFRGYSVHWLGGDYAYREGQGLFTEDGRIWQPYAFDDFDYVFRTHMTIPEPSPAELTVIAGLLIGFRRLLAFSRRPQRTTSREAPRT